MMASFGKRYLSMWMYVICMFRMMPSEYYVYLHICDLQGITDGLPSILALESENLTMLLFSGLKFWNYYLLISLNPVEKTKKLVKSRVHFLLEWIVDTLLTTEV